MRSHSEADLQRWLAVRVSTYLEVDVTKVDTNATWDDLGLSSRDAVALSGELETYLGVTLSPTIAWEHPTIAELSRALTLDSPPPREPVAQPADQSPGGSIAIVGLGCRFPGGADGPQEFWKLLLEGRHGIGQVPAERWADFDDGTPETAALLARTTRWGGYLPDVAGFDAEHFGISAVEAEHMDPQQRLLLEVAQEALDHAGLAREQLRGSATGVFVGACSPDYGHLTTADLSSVDAWTGTGAALSIIANRLSYLLDLRGPSLVVDTACSSSLVGIHLACASLRRGETSLAMAAGVNLLLSPATTVNFDRAGAMAADGRCKTFDAEADGYVRGEGCGVVVLKRLGDAQRDGNAVLAVIRGSAIGSDGRSNGLMAPNPLAQEALLQTAYRQADIAPGDLDYVEAHGTGTPLGDRMEVGALSAVCGIGRPADRPLLIGSAKTNLGHLEAAAGMVGVIKTTLALLHGQIPPSLNFTTANPRIDFAGMQVPVEPTPWPHRTGPALAGVSAFGFGGTNAHVILEQAQPGPQDEVWVFSGQGSQWAGMGRQLLADEPVFAASVDEIDEVVLHASGFSVRELLSSGGAVTEIDHVQPLIFAMQMGLAALWRAAGAEPRAVIGHSMGEVAAAAVAGILSVPDAARLIARRSRLMRRIAGQGAMAVIDRGAAEVTDLVKGYPDVTVAVHTSPCQTIVSGPATRVTEMVDACLARDVTARLVAVDVASHSALVDPLLPLLSAAACDLRPHAPRVTFYSTVTADSEPRFDAAYWTANLRRPVLFTQAVTQALEDGHTRFIEISPHPVLLDAIAQTAGQRAITVLPSLRRGSASFSPFHPPQRSWRHRTYWPKPRINSAGSGRPAADSFLGVPVSVPTVPRSRLWQSRLLPDALPYPQPHLVGGVSIAPGSVLVNTALLAAAGAVAKVQLLHPLVLDAPCSVQVAEQAGRLRLVASADRDSPALTHLVARTMDEVPEPLVLADLPTTDQAGLDASDAHQLLARHEVQSAYPWQVVSLIRAGSRADALVDFPLDQAAGVAAILDAALTLVSFVAAGPLRLLIPARINQAWLGATLSSPLLSARLKFEEVTAGVFDVVAETPDGGRILSLAGVGCQDAGDTARQDDVLTRQVLWSPVEVATGGPVFVAPAPASSHPADPVEQAVQLCRAVIDRLEALSADRNAPASRQRLTVITRGMRSADPDFLSHAALWGLASVAAEEHPEVWGGIVDLDPDQDLPATAAKVIRGFAPVLAPLAGPPVRDRLTCRPGGAYLVTGGLGALGLEIAAHLAEHGARRVVLLGRTGLPPRITWREKHDERLATRIRSVLDLEAAGVCVEIVALDVAAPGALQAWLGQRELQGLPRIWGVVHAAGTISDRELTRLDDEALRMVLRPKLAGGLAVHECFPPGSLDFLVFFSSAAVLYGVTGQGAYAAANACLDALARERAGHGCHALSINWGSWKGLGLASSPGGRVVDSALDANGLRPLSAPEATSAWDRLDRHDIPQGLVVATSGHDEDLPEGLRDVALASDTDTNAQGWARLTSVEQLDELQVLIAKTLGLDPESLDLDRPLAELGMDSILSLRVRHGIQSRTGIKVGVTAAWNHPTVRALGSHLEALQEPDHQPDTGTPPGEPSSIENLLQSIEGA